MPAGRPTGSTNKNSVFLLNRLQDIYGDDFHPIMKIAENCATIQDIADQCKDEMDNIELVETEAELNEEGSDVDFGNVTRVISLAKLANENWEKLAPYIAPKLKATEITGEDGGPVQVQEVKRTIVDTQHPDS